MRIAVPGGGLNVQLPSLQKGNEANYSRVKGSQTLRQHLSSHRLWHSITTVLPENATQTLSFWTKFLNSILTSLCSRPMLNYSDKATQLYSWSGLENSRLVFSFSKLVLTQIIWPILVTGREMYIKIRLESTQLRWILWKRFALSLSKLPNKRWDLTPHV